jgi:hypothetical protein
MNTTGVHLDTRGGASDVVFRCQYAVGTSSLLQIPVPISAIERVCDVRGSRSQTILRVPRFTAHLSTVKGRTVAVDEEDESISDSVGRRTGGLDALGKRPVIRSHQ